MDPSRPTRVLIVGAGLAGSLLACFLARRGMAVEVIERRPDPRAKGFTGGRSINLALSARGIDALSRVGLAERVLADGIPMRGRMMHSTAGKLTFQAYSKDPNDAINSVGRGSLNVALLEVADALENVCLRFGSPCLDIDLDRPAGLFLHEASGEEFTADADVILGADGAFSAVRGRLQKTDRFDYSQSYLEHGYKELTIPPAGSGDFAMDPNALHIWPRGGYMMIALPNPDRSFTCTCFWPYQGRASFAAIEGADDVVPFFQEHFPDAVPLMPTLVEDYLANPIGSLVTIRCRPWHHGRVAILGDAAHAIVPFFGQGMNAAFQDCSVLDELLDAHGDDWDAVLPRFTAAQHEHAHAIADMALENFIEMRDRVASPWFLLRKKGQHLLHRLFPRRCMPLYNMVSFSCIPYASARRRARQQAFTVRAILVAAATLLILAVALATWSLL